MKKYILSIDQGTTSTRAILFTKDGRPYATSQKEITCLFPHSGWVECDPYEIWVSTVTVITEVIAKGSISFDDIDSFAITNQRETTIVWDKFTGQPVYNAIVWQSRQTAEICDRYADKKEYIHQRTGLLINPYFSASKIRFILDHIPNGQERADRGELSFGTIDTWLIYKLTGHKNHLTDVSNASRTLLFNINTMKWDKDLCSLFNIPMKMLPKVCPCSYDFGKIDSFKCDAHICGVAGDQQAALFGQTCFEKGEAKNTYGTGCFMLLNTGDKPVYSKNGLLTTIGWQIGDKTTYALEGSVFIGGAVVQWLRDEIKLIHSSGESEEKAVKCDHTHDIYVVPAFVGLGTPYWDDEARGAIFGLTRGTTDAHIVRASLEAIAYQCKDVFEVMKKETKIPFKSIQVDGGATANSYLMQFQSDILKILIKLPEVLETTALGVAYFAGLFTGFYRSLDTIKKTHDYKAVFEPHMKDNEIKNRYAGWKAAIKATKAFKI